MSLLRKEAIEHQNNTSHGEIIIPASFGMTFSAVTTLLLLLFIILFIYFGSYTRKAHLTGIVMPSSGLIKITPQYAGNVTSLTIQEGQHVTAGEALYHLSGEHYNDQGAGTLAAMSLSLKTQHAMLVSQQTLEQHDNILQQQAIRQRTAELQPQISSAVQRLTEAERRAELATAVMSRYRKLLITHYVSDVEFQQKQIEVSSAQENVENQRQALLQLRSAQDAAQDDLIHLIAQGKSRQTELDRQLQGLQQQLIELAGQEHFTLTAPVSGTVAAVLIRQGQSVKSSEAVMTLVPDNARLQIELYATSQNAGFIQPGQRVALRFAGKRQATAACCDY